MIERMTAIEHRPPETQPRFTFIVPVRNERARIDSCLQSIRAQRYAADRIEIIVPDQSSDDDTRERARAYGATVIQNPQQRAIFSMPEAFRRASGDLIAVMAADNRVEPEFCERMAEPFEVAAVGLAFPWVTTDRPDYALAVRYFNRFTDPMNHFIYGEASNPRDLPRAIPPVETTPRYDVYRFAPNRPPLLAIAQGAVVRAPFLMKEGYADDLGVVFDMIEDGGLVACVKAALVDHYTADGLADLLRKFRPRIAKNLRPNSSLRWRDRYLPADRIRRRSLWPVYAASIVAPTLVGVSRAVLQREPLWLYHPIMNASFAWVTLLAALADLPNALSLLFGRSSPPASASKE